MHAMLTTGWLQQHGSMARWPKAEKRQAAYHFGGDSIKKTIGVSKC